jgi:hypothetical protein
MRALCVRTPHTHLHAEADAEVGHLVLARVLRSQDLALHAAVAKAAGHKHAVRRAQLCARAARKAGA